MEQDGSREMYPVACGLGNVYELKLRINRVFVVLDIRSVSKRLAHFTSSWSLLLVAFVQ
jgi:hypothetical protein